ncbi:hypothetical protein [Planctomicrobium sp. SH664]|uniref:hypothetical protein n=1 Tax=Planctomicrobium sp. SH664 TaxID=3448125 RepID=UPI003F5BF526
MNWLGWLFLSTVAFEVPPEPASRGDLILVVGSAGTPEYGEQFQTWGRQWAEAAARGELSVHAIGLTPDAPATLDAFRERLAALDPHSLRPLWIVLIGHGTFDGRFPKFNLPGPDLEADELGRLLTPFDRPMAVIDCFSSSAPFLRPVARPGRVVITATQSGNEENFSRFGGFMASALSNPLADLDKNEQVSLLEAFLFAARETEAFYEADGRLATEHAVIDDNGDARPLPATAFRGTRPVQYKEVPNQLPDGLLANQWHLIPNDLDRQLTPEQIARRSEIEQEMALLRSRKSLLTEDEYYDALESYVLELARLLIERRPPVGSSTPASAPETIPSR